MIFRKNSSKLRSVAVTGQRERPYCSTIKVRSFNFLIDEPEKMGGKDKAPTPMEYVLGALNGCFAITIEMVAKEFECKIENLNIQSEGQIDPRGLFGTASVSPHFQKIKVHIELSADNLSKFFRVIKKESMKRCPVFNLVKDSGAHVQVEWLTNGGKSY